MTEERLCTGCQQTKPLSDFYKFKAGPMGHTTRCKVCMNNSQKRYAATPKGKTVAREKYAKWRAANLELARKLSREGNDKGRKANPERFKDYDRKKLYGIPAGTYAAMLEAQESKCAICRAPDPGGKGIFHIDHCHSSKIVRGLLCHHCNLMLGHAKDDPQRLEAAVAYLGKFTSSAEGG